MSLITKAINKPINAKKQSMPNEKYLYFNATEVFLGKELSTARLSTSKSLRQMARAY